MLRGLPVLFALSACTGAPAPAPETGDAPAHRIVSQTILSDEVLWALGPAAQARVVGVSALADDPRYSGVAGVWPPATPRRALTSEGLLALAPDLAVIASFTSPEVRELLTSHGVRLLEFTRFTGFADYRSHVRQLAAAVEDPAAGERLIADLDGRLARLAARRPAIRLAAVSWGDGHAAAAGTSFDDVAEAAGLSNMAKEKGLEGHVPVALELMVSWDPPVIVTGCPAPEPDDPACRAAEAAVAALPGVRATAAARGGRIFAVPARALASTGEGMARAAEILQDRLRAEPP
ncbi:ABC transporter substrate-binding protein [Nannocystis bainbridge]|uniref:ABC transporter substrate-binding protein n=1 Tax=Nannocystis bainbridge TaxID=2995303 RepID=A0ABT5DQP7_9BACT|nr:ABC transporter substrate-binding protein [Nannocystis bainbridge]MDC0715453.1 ABC transporter substrate-binding protein [Nannocystis bainbridge]